MALAYTCDKHSVNFFNSVPKILHTYPTKRYYLGLSLTIVKSSFFPGFKIPYLSESPVPTAKLRLNTAK